MIHQEMDIDHEWILINQDDEKKIHGGKRVSDTKLVFLTDYFDEHQRQPQPPKVVVPVSFPLEPKEINNKRVPIDFTSTPTMILEKIKEAGIQSVEGGGGGGGGNKEVMTQVSFRKPSYNNNNESVDMTNKMDSPRSTTKGGNMTIPQIDATGTFNFDDESEVLQNLSSPKIKDFLENKAVKNKDVVVDDDDDGGGLNLWKLSLNGIGAICSFGVAAATFCIIVFGSQQRHKLHQEQNQKLLFQRYTDDKRIKQVVRHTTKLNDAISAVRGVPITRAHITFGGYYDGI